MKNKGLLRSIRTFIVSAKLKNKLIIAFSILTVTSSVVVGTVSYYVLNNYASDSVSDSIVTILESSMQSIDDRLNDIDGLLRNIISSKDLIEMLENPSPSSIDMISYTSDFQNYIYLNLFGFRSKFIDYVYIFGKNNVHLLSNPVLFFSKRDFSYLESVKYVRKAEEMQGKMLWFTTEGDVFNNFEPVTGFTSIKITGIRKLHTYQSILSGNRVEWGFMVIKIDKEYINEIIKEAAAKIESTLLMVDSGGHLVLQEGNGKFLKDTDSSLVALLRGKGNGSHRVRIGDNEYIGHVIISEYTGWSLISITSQELLGKGIKKLLFVIQFAVLAMILVSTILAILISSGITKPVKRMLEKMECIKRGNLDVSIEVDRKDEVGLLAENFNKMTLDIKKLLEKITNDQTEIRKSELKALQAQINPHFLYNTLDAIYWMAMKAQNHDIAKITISLSSFFRLSLNKGSDVTTIANEIEHASKYLIIHQMRFKGKFDFFIELEDSIRGNESVNLILQPIVENSLVHGFKHKKSVGMIWIKAKEKAGLVLIEVKDNGYGFDPDNMRKIVNDSNTETGSSYGLKNVNNRIKLYYGEEYGLSFRTDPSGGAVVEIHLPLVKKGTGNQYSMKNND